MLPTTIRSPPSLDDFTPLAEHQSRTPETFYGGKPVLHYHATGVRAWIPAAQRGGGLPFFPADSTASAPSGHGASVLNGSAEEMVEQVVDLFVTSDTFILFCPSDECGVSIPYPSISLHAVKQLGVASATGTKISSIYLQLELSDGGADDDSFDTVELTLIPPTTNPPAAASGEAPSAQTGTETAALFDAISACSNLHPDPTDGDDEDDEYDDDRIVFEGDHEAIEGFEGVFHGAVDGGLPPPMPGSSGWITAENMHEYFDEEGNWIGDDGVSGELGDGAGRVRGREEVEDEAVNGHGPADDGESKRPRTE